MERLAAVAQQQMLWVVAALANLAIGALSATPRALVDLRRLGQPDAEAMVHLAASDAT